MRARVTLWALLLGLLLPACGRDGGPGPRLAPDFRLPSVDGTMVRLSDARGKVVVVDFWATWCPPCREMIPILSRLHREYSARGVVVLGVSLDEEGLAVLSPFVFQERIPYRVLLGDLKVGSSFGGVSSIPTLFIVDRGGRLVRKLEGYHTFEQVEEEVARYL